jgi:hypothetical protein
MWIFSRLFYRFRKIREDIRLERLRQALNTKPGEWRWSNDYSERSQQLHFTAAHLLGIKEQIFGWVGLAKAFGLPVEASQPVIQNVMALKIGENLGVEHLPLGRHDKISPPNWLGIATALGLDPLRKIKGDELPIPFIIYAFIDFKRR